MGATLRRAATAPHPRAAGVAGGPAAVRRARGRAPPRAAPTPSTAAVARRHRHLGVLTGASLPGRGRPGRRRATGGDRPIGRFPPRLARLWDAGAMRTLAILAAALATLVLAQVAPARTDGDPAPPSARAVAAGTGVCAPWRVRTLLQGQGWLENLAFDGRGGITISALAQRKVLRLGPNGRLSTLVAPVNAPGGQVRRGRVLSFVTGNGPTPRRSGRSTASTCAPGGGRRGLAA